MECEVQTLQSVAIHPGFQPWKEVRWAKTMELFDKRMIDKEYKTNEMALYGPSRLFICALNTLNGTVATSI